MKGYRRWIAVALISCLCGCEQAHDDAAALRVEFSWKGVKRCEWGNPQISIAGVPAQTRFLVLSMFDHAYSHDHGEVRFAYAGETVIAKDRFKGIQGPCPAWSPGRYEVTIKALDDKERVVGIGSCERPFPE